MSCFWNALLNAIYSNQLTDMRKLYKLKKKKMKPVELVLFLKSHNRKTKNVLWQNELLTDKQLNENMNAIKSYNCKTVQNGYFCSVFEPFLFLFSELFNVNIKHKYINNIIEYTHTNKCIFEILLSSNKTHIDFINIKKIKINKN